MIMKWQIKFAASLLGSMSMASGLARAGIGDLDPAYGAGGIVLTSVPTGALGDGSLIYHLHFEYTEDDATNYVHMDINGHPDPHFGVAGRLSLPLAPLSYPGFGFPPPQDSRYLPTALRTPAGQLLFSVLANDTVSLLRLDATGHPDPSFGTAGFVGIAPFNPPCAGEVVVQLAFQPDGHLLTMLSTFGNDEYADVLGSVAIRRFDSNGSPDATFNNGTGVTNVSTIHGCGTNAFEDQLEAPDALNLLQDGSMDILLPAGRTYVSADGENMAGPPASPGLRTDVAEWRYGGTLADGDVLLTNGATPQSIQSASDDGSPSTTIIARLHPDGTLDTTFGGAGTGYAQLNIGALVSSETDIAENVQISRISADGQHLYVAVLLVRRCGNSCPSGATLGLAVVRLLVEGTQAGTLDSSFGHNGVVLMSKAAGLNITDLIEQPGGAVVVVLTSDALETALAMRLLGNATPSPGLIGAAGDYFEVPPSQATAQVHVARTLGKDGAVSVSYAIGNSPGLVPYNDYTPVSGQLDWADGDFADKIITIPVFHQPTRTTGSEKYLHVALTAPTGGALLLSGDVQVAIDVAPGPSSSTPPPTSTTQTASPSSGGGGSFGLGSLALLALCFLMAGTRARRARA
jgi:uncharacterized delta-60 repeat protein